jgi:hypothetical protein
MPLLMQEEAELLRAAGSHLRKGMRGSNSKGEGILTFGCMGP